MSAGFLLAEWNVLPLFSQPPTTLWKRFKYVMVGGEEGTVVILVFVLLFC